MTINNDMCKVTENAFQVASIGNSFGEYFVVNQKENTYTIDTYHFAKYSDSPIKYECSYAVFKIASWMSRYSLTKALAHQIDRAMGFTSIRNGKNFLVEMAKAYNLHFDSISATSLRKIVLELHKRCNPK